MGVGEFICVAGVMAVCLAWRLLPLLRQPYQGCDAYYFLLCREVLRRERRLPVVLPRYYTLEDQRQRYPPGFMVFLALLPTRFLQRYFWAISPLVDTALCGGLTAVALWLTGSSLAAGAGGLVYALSSASIAETQAMTSRQLGALLMSVTLLAGIGAAVERSLPLAVLAVAGGTLLLLTHKLSVQALLLTLPVLAIVDGQLWLAGLLPLAVLGAVVISGGFYRQIARCHWDYIWLWTRHWPRLGGHQVHDSPVYGTPSDRDRVYKSGWAPRLRGVWGYARQNLYAVVPVAMLAGHLWREPLPKREVLLASATVLILLTGLLSYLVPWLRGIGYMHQYGKLALAPGVLCVASASRLPVYWPLAMAVTAWAAIDGLRFLNTALRRPAAGAAHPPNELAHLFDQIRQLPSPHLMCIPNTLCDLVVWHCRVPVAWGTHNSPTTEAELLCPVIARPLDELVARFGVTHLLVDATYADPQTLGLSAPPLWRAGSLNLYESTAVAASRSAA